MGLSGLGIVITVRRIALTVGHGALRLLPTRLVGGRRSKRLELRRV